jgi:MFS family permease
MSGSLRNVAALIATITILQLAGGLIGVRLPLAFGAEGFSNAALGLVAAAYSAGFMLGAAAATTLLSRVGPIRVYSACAALFAAATLALHFAGDVWTWGFMRLIAGISVALLFASVESWISWSIEPGQRGEVLSIYMVVTKAALAVGPFLAFSYDAIAPEPWMIAAGLAALSMIPICFTSTRQPDPPTATPLAMVEQFATAPAAVIACFGAGFINTGLLALAPLHAAERFGAGGAAAIYAAAWIGSLLLQWPAGRLSDRMDRRIVIAGLTVLSGLAAIPLALLSQSLSQWALVALYFVWGAGALSHYGVAIAHMADRAEPGKLAQAAAGLLFIWAAGSVLGPVTLGLVVDFAGATGMYTAVAIASFVLAAAMFWRSTARQAATPEQKEGFAPQPASSVAAAEIAYGHDKPEPI